MAKRKSHKYRSAAQKRAAIRNLKKARAALKRKHRGGNKKGKKGGKHRK